MSFGQSDKQQMAERLLELCQQAGQAIVDIYQAAEPVVVEQKQDGSPLTQADKASHDIISQGLASLTPQWPVLSEEQALPHFAERSQWSPYWLLDPLDGTREFIARSGEFTINIALIEYHRPVLGMIYIPLQQTAYLGLVEEKKRCVLIRLGTAILFAVITHLAMRLGYGSSRHAGTELESCIDKLSRHFQSVDRATAGSALKFCRLAEGVADIYPRFAPCCEWDTAAGQAVLEAAGGCLVDMDFKSLQYNRKASIINPHFYALGGAPTSWTDILKE